VKRDQLGDFYICIVTNVEESKPDYAASGKVRISVPGNTPGIGSGLQAALDRECVMMV